MPRGENRPSFLLSRDENEQVFSLIGPKCQSLATAVVQLFTTEGPTHSEWKKKDTGVLCLIKDNGKRSYFFRIYCLYRKAMIWEHEVYLQIEYKSPRQYLHTFEAEEYMTAFNFANEDEAHILRKILIEKIELRKIRREERRQRALSAARASNLSSVSRQNGVLPPPPAPVPEPEPEPEPAPVLPPKSTLPGTYTLKSSNKKPKTRKLTKADIGMPQDFKHISHVGWDEHRGFDVETTQPNEELLSFFSMAGVSEKQLQDEETREFIYSFIERNGGIDAVKEDLHTSNAKPVRSGSRTGALPPVPTSSPPAPPSALPAPPSTPAPPVPQRSPAPAHPPAPPSRAPPPPPSRAVPPPPPPLSVQMQKTAPPPRPLPPSSAPPSVPPPPPPGVAPPPPPPPPPAPPTPPAAPPAPPAPPMPVPTPADGATTATSAADPRAALMESIRSGNKTLKRVEVNNKPPAVESDSRSNLLDEIRQGIELKSVSRSDSNSASERKPAVPVCGLAGALARALQERSRAIHSDTDDDDDDNTSDGEWTD